MKFKDDIMNMKFSFKLIALVGTVALFAIVILQTKYPSSLVPSMKTSGCSEGSVEPIFSPDNSEEIFSVIKNAKSEIKLEVYEFSYKALADALIDSRERGVSVKVILEPSVYQNSETLNYLINSGIAVNWASKKFHNTHSKFMIVDDSIVVVGSMNWSENAFKKNREASVIIYSKEISSEFERIFDDDFGSGN